MGGRLLSSSSIPPSTPLSVSGMRSVWYLIPPPPPLDTLSASLCRVVVTGSVSSDRGVCRRRRGRERARGWSVVEVWERAGPDLLPNRESKMGSGEGGRIAYCTETEWHRVTSMGRIRTCRDHGLLYRAMSHGRVIYDCKRIVTCSSISIIHCKSRQRRTVDK